MEKTKSCLLLGLILKKILRKQYSQGFTTLHTNAKNIKEMVFKNIMQNNKRLQQGKLMRCFRWILYTGRINLDQRALWRWKIQVFPLTQHKVSLMVYKDKKALLRSLKIFSRLSKRPCMVKFFTRWKFTSTSILKEKQLNEYRLNENKDKLFNSIIRFIIFNIKNRLKSILSLWRKNSIPKENKTLNAAGFRLLNHISEKILRSYFKKWKEPEYYYYQQVEEITISKTEVMNFRMFWKPCTYLDYFDETSYDPAFRAVFRNLEYFLRKIKKSYFLNWCEEYKRQSIRITSVASYLVDSPLGPNIYRLSNEQKRKLKIVLIYILDIQRKVNEMPIKSLSHWSRRAHTNHLKLIKCKLLILKNQEKYHTQQRFFQNLKENFIHENNFTDKD